MFDSYNVEKYSIEKIFQALRKWGYDIDVTFIAVRKNYDLDGRDENKFSTPWSSVGRGDGDRK